VSQLEAQAGAGRGVLGPARDETEMTDESHVEAAVAPVAERAIERDAHGKFLPRGPGGPGRRRRDMKEAFEHELQVVLAANNWKRMRTLIDKMVGMAERGNPAMMSLCLKYSVGLPRDLAYDRSRLANAGGRIAIREVIIELPQRVEHLRGGTGPQPAEASQAPDPGSHMPTEQERLEKDEKEVESEADRLRRLQQEHEKGLIDRLEQRRSSGYLGEDEISNLARRQA